MSRNHVVLSLLPCCATWAFGCGELADETPTVTTIVELVAAPTRVSTIRVEVVDVARDEIVTSTTSFARNTSFPLGVPAETLLEFRVTARTDRPGPDLGKMPAFWGALRREIPLRSEPQKIQVAVRPAGALTFVPEFFDALEASDVELAFRRIDGDEEVVLRQALSSSDSSRFVYLPLREGRYRVGASRVGRRRSQDLFVDAQDGVFVRREIESVARFQIRAVREVPPEDAPYEVLLSIADEDGQLLDPAEILRVPAERERPFALRPQVLDAQGRTVLISAVEWSLRWETTGSVVLSAPSRGGGLPTEIPGLRVRGVGRVHFIFDIVHAGEPRRLSNDLFFNVAPSGVVPGLPSRLELSIRDPERLVSGSSLFAELLDHAGLSADLTSDPSSDPSTGPSMGRTLGRIDFSSSDPWAFLADGATTELEEGDFGRVKRTLVRSSQPRGAPVSLRAVYTSSNSQMLESMLMLPTLEVSR